jgi:F-type H+-transporting ATPase subunit b
VLAEYQRKAKDATAEAGEIIEQAKREAEALGAEARQKMADYVASRTRMAEQKIAQAEAQALQEVKALSADVAIAAAEKVLAAAPGVDLDYVAVRAVDLAELDEDARGEARALVAAKVGTTRLIDNMPVVLGAPLRH